MHGSREIFLPIVVHWKHFWSFNLDWNVLCSNNKALNHKAELVAEKVVEWKLLGLINSTRIQIILTRSRTHDWELKLMGISNRTSPIRHKLLEGSPQQQRSLRPQGWIPIFHWNAWSAHKVFTRKKILRLMHWLAGVRAPINARLSHLTRRCHCVLTNDRCVYVRSVNTCEPMLDDVDESCVLVV